MKFAMCNEMFQGWDVDRQFNFIAECGYDGVELAPFTLSDNGGYASTPCGDIRELTRTAREGIVRASARAGIRVAGLHWILSKTEGFHLTTNDASVRRRTTEYLRELAYFCRDLGGEYMVLGSPMQRSCLPGVSMHQAYKNAISTIEPVLNALEESRVLLALEPLTAAETSFIQTGADALYLINKLGRPQSLGIHLDCKAMFGSEKESIPDVIQTPELRPFLKTFHANDPNLQGPGFGDLDFTLVMAALKTIEFDGWVGVEPFDFQAGIERVARESLQTLKASL
ncbi:MAG: sugar phosphate isomerase/epimerase family protein [Planctomycetia bacterium]|nr:sugar phosphate isomerase/epimerase family protein [Planctomycetia bacterium]